MKFVDVSGNLLLQLLSDKSVNQGICTAQDYPLGMGYQIPLKTKHKQKKQKPNVAAEHIPIVTTTPEIKTEDAKIKIEADMKPEGDLHSSSFLTGVFNSSAMLSCGAYFLGQWTETQLADEGTTLQEDVSAEIYANAENQGDAEDTINMIQAELDNIDVQPQQTPWNTAMVSASRLGSFDGYSGDSGDICFSVKVSDPIYLDSIHEYDTLWLTTTDNKNKQRGAADNFHAVVVKQIHNCTLKTFIKRITLTDKTFSDTSATRPVRAIVSAVFVCSID